VERFPDAAYEGREITVQKLSNDMLQVRVAGELYFTALRIAIPFDARVTTMGTLLHICGDFALRQSDYGINLVSLPGGLAIEG